MFIGNIIQGHVYLLLNLLPEPAHLTLPTPTSGHDVLATWITIGTPFEPFWLPFGSQQSSARDGDRQIEPPK